MFRFLQGMLVGTAVIAAVMGIVYVRMHQSDVAAVALPSATDSASTLQPEWQHVQTGNVTGISNRVASPALSESAAVSTTESVTSVEAAGAVSGPATPLQEQEPGQSRAEKVLAKVDAKFESEATDDIWSTETSDVINGYFAAAATGNDLSRSTLNDVECHSSLCRIEVVHEDEQAMQEFALQFPMQMGQSLPRITYQTDHRADGRVAMVMYLSSGVQ